MTSLRDTFPSLSRGTALGVGAALLLAVGAAGGAGAVSLTRPTIEMAPLNATPISKLASGGGVVTVKGKVVEVFGDRIVIQDQTGRAMIDVGRATDPGLAVGQGVMVQGRYGDDQFHASYLVGVDGRVTALGPAGAPHGPGGPGGPDRLPHEAPLAGSADHAAPLLAPVGCDNSPGVQPSPPPSPSATKTSH